MKKTFENPSENLGNHKDKDSQRRDYGARCSTSLQPSDRALICNLSQRGVTGKLSKFWEEKVHKTSQVLDEEVIV